jgi:hypothetical protein
MACAARVVRTKALPPGGWLRCNGRTGYGDGVRRSRGATATARREPFTPGAGRRDPWALSPLFYVAPRTAHPVEP